MSYKPEKNLEDRLISAAKKHCKQDKVSFVE